jgi:hypothetical protein
LAFKGFELDLPSGSIIYADKQYNDYHYEDLLEEAALGLTRFREPIRVKRSGSVKGVEEDGQERQALLA